MDAHQHSLVPRAMAHAFGPPHSGHRAALAAGVVETSGMHWQHTPPRARIPLDSRGTDLRTITAS